MSRRLIHLSGLHGPLSRHRIQSTYGKSCVGAKQSYQHHPPNGQGAFNTLFAVEEDVSGLHPTRSFTADSLLQSQQSCISEAQKYQGALYRAPQPKNSGNRKSVTIDSSALVSRKAYVEDAPDPDYGSITIVDPPPPAPSPPPAVQASSDAVNVFDFLVTEQTPNASRVSLGGSKEQMKMVEHAPSVFEAGDQLARISNGHHDEMNNYADEFVENGYSYGAEPVSLNHDDDDDDDRRSYLTPAPKRDRESRTRKAKDGEGRDRPSTDKKRKRHHVEDLDLTAARPSSLDSRDDEIMEDAPPELHSGLTGGLTRLLSNSEFPPSPDYSGGDGFEASPLSPLKRSRTGLEIHKVKVRPGRTSSALVRTRKISNSTRTSDESRPRKHHRKHRTHHDVHVDQPHSTTTSRKLKAIQYHPDANTDESHHQQLTLYRSRAEHFLSFVQKGPESEHGCSVNKALKRYHRERGELGLSMGTGKAEEEKELWKGLRLRRNERGEIVVFF